VDAIRRHALAPLRPTAESELTRVGAIEPARVGAIELTRVGAKVLTQVGAQPDVARCADGVLRGSCGMPNPRRRRKVESDGRQRRNDERQTSAAWRWKATDVSWCGVPRDGRNVIVESIVTTIDRDGRINCAPMGVEWDDEVIVLKPFLDTATYRNVTASRSAVVNLTDDVRVFAQAAISNPVYPTVAATAVGGVVLADCCSWRELEVRSVDATPPRSRIDTAVVHRGFRREFIGFNRACHAVLETAIYATRLHLLEAPFVRSELERLQVIVDKTAGAREREAMALLTAHIRGVIGG
jgi:hypothetical protein